MPVNNLSPVGSRYKGLKSFQLMTRGTIPTGLKDMKKYVVYIEYNESEKGRCPHDFKEFDNLPEAVRYFEGEKFTDKKWILKTITWKTIYAEVEDPVRAEKTDI